MKRHGVWLAGLLACGMATAAPPGGQLYPPGHAFIIDDAQRLERFRVVDPARRLGSVPLRGMPAGETIVGIDFRPHTGELLGVGTDSRLYRIDPSNGLVKRIGLPFSPLLAGTAFGIEVDPALDRVRLSSNTGQSLRVHPDTGRVEAVEAAIVAGTSLVALAHSDNRPGSTASRLYGLDATNDRLVLREAPGDGTVTAVGPLGVDVTEGAAFDTLGRNAYAVIGNVLYVVNLLTGNATVVGTLGTTGNPRALAIATGPDSLVGLTVGDRLVRFLAHAPGTLLSEIAVTGLQGGEILHGIDVRPADGQLFGIGSSNRVYRLDALTGVAVAMNATPFMPGLAGTHFGVDFFPGANFLRVVSDVGQHLRISPGANVGALDGAIAPPFDLVALGIAGALGEGFGGPMAGFALDAAGNQMHILNPNDGSLLPQGPTGLDITGLTGFDIAPRGQGYISLAEAEGSPTRLYAINAPPSGQTAALIGTVGGGATLRDIAVELAPEIAYGLTTQAGPIDRIVRFNPSLPDVILSSVQVSGLQPLERLVGIDVRPATGALYGLGNSSQLYRVDAVTGVATAVSSQPFTPTLSGSTFGFDFDPVTDRLRVVSTTEQNLRLDPDSGLAIADAPLAPAGNVSGAAFTDNAAGVGSTRLFDIDWAASLLVRQQPADAGTLTPVGPLGITLSSSVLSLDVGQLGGQAWLMGYTGSLDPQVFRVNLDTGAASTVGFVAVDQQLVGISLTGAPVDPDVFRDGFE